MIPAIVLTAGLATRLRPLSLVRAKAALPVAGEPLVRRILRQLQGAGVTDVVLNLHHLPHSITGLVGDGADLGLRVRYSWEAPVLGSAGGPRRALPLLQDAGDSLDPSVFIVNGDTLTDVDLGALARAHRGSGALVTMAVTPNPAPDTYGGVTVTDDGVVTGFVGRGSTARSYHFVGVQAARASAFDAVPAHVPYETVRTLYPALIAERPGAIRAFVSTAECLDIGTPADYVASARLLASREGRADALRGERTEVDETAFVEGSILWDDVVVGPGVTLQECVVTDRVRVPAGTTWRRAMLRVAADDVLPGERLVGSVALSAIEDRRT